MGSTTGASICSFISILGQKLTDYVAVRPWQGESIGQVRSWPYHIGEYAKVGVVVYHYTVWPYHFQTACWGGGCVPLLMKSAN